MRTVLRAALVFLAACAPAFAQSINPTIVTGTMIGTSPVLVSLGHARLFLEIDNPSATATIACTFGQTVTAAVNGAGSVTLSPVPSSNSYRQYSVGFIPTDNLYCVASAASTPLSVFER